VRRFAKRLLLEGPRRLEETLAGAEKTVGGEEILNVEF
jgi:hypothetical protein